MYGPASQTLMRPYPGLNMSSNGRSPFKWSLHLVFAQMCLSQAEGAMETKTRCLKKVFFGALSLYCVSEKYPSEEENAAVCYGLAWRHCEVQKETE